MEKPMKMGIPTHTKSSLFTSLIVMEPSNKAFATATMQNMHAIVKTIIMSGV